MCIRDRMRSTLNQDAKVDMIKELQVMVAEEYYKIPLYTTQVLSAARTDRFTGFVEKAGSTFFNNETLKNLTMVSVSYTHLFPQITSGRSI